VAPVSREVVIEPRSDLVAEGFLFPREAEVH
jgi:hypothetical protein